MVTSGTSAEVLISEIGTSEAHADGSRPGTSNGITDNFARASGAHPDVRISVNIAAPARSKLGDFLCRSEGIPSGPAAFPDARHNVDLQISTSVEL